MRLITSDSVQATISKASVLEFADAFHEQLIFVKQKLHLQLVFIKVLNSIKKFCCLVALKFANRIVMF